MDVDDSDNGTNRRDGIENNQDSLSSLADLTTPAASRIARGAVITQTTPSTPPPATYEAFHSAKHVKQEFLPALTPYAGLVGATTPAARFADPTLTPTSPFLTASPTASADDLKRAIIKTFSVAADFNGCKTRTDFLDRVIELRAGASNASPRNLFTPTARPIACYSDIRSLERDCTQALAIKINGDTEGSSLIAALLELRRRRHSEPWNAALFVDKISTDSNGDDHRVQIDLLADFHSISLRFLKHFT